MSETQHCARCGRPAPDQESPEFLYWEALPPHGTEVICEGCVTAEEQQAMDEDTMDLVSESNLETIREIDALPVVNEPQRGGSRCPSWCDPDVHETVPSSEDGIVLHMHRAIVDTIRLRGIDMPIFLEQAEGVDAAGQHQWEAVTVVCEGALSMTVEEATRYGRALLEAARHATAAGMITESGL